MKVQKSNQFGVAVKKRPAIDLTTRGESRCYCRLPEYFRPRHAASLRGARPEDRPPRAPGNWPPPALLNFPGSELGDGRRDERDGAETIQGVHGDAAVRLPAYRVGCLRGPVYSG